jgi:hypothetical protein
MATGRIHRSARRGIAAAMLGWLGVAGAAVLLAPAASAAATATVEIRTATPPATSVDAGGTVTFVNKVDSYATGANLGALGSFGATVNTDVSVTFFGQRRDLQVNQSAAWTFSAPVTTGQITYTYRIVPAAGTPAAVANQVVGTVAAGLPALPAPTPHVVQTLAPAVPNLPSKNLPPLPQVDVPLPPGSPPPVQGPGPGPEDDPPADPDGDGTVDSGLAGIGYTYGDGGGAPRMSPSDAVAAAAFDPSRFYVPGRSLGGADRAGSGGMAGSYDGASVPVFGQLAGLDGTALDEESAEEAAASGPAAQTLPAAALAAVVALAAVTASLVRTHQASRASR